MEVDSFFVVPLPLVLAFSLSAHAVANFCQTFAILSGSAMMIATTMEGSATWGFSSAPAASPTAVQAADRKSVSGSCSILVVP